MLDKIMSMATGMKAVGISPDVAKVKIFKKVKSIRIQDINLIVDVVYKED